MRETSLGDIVLIPPIAEPAACPAFVAGMAGAPVKLTGPGPFAPKEPGTATPLDGNPAVIGLALVGAALDVPVAG